MTMQGEIYNYLTSTTAATVNIIGTRMYIGILPQGTDLPAITWARVAADRLQSLSGSSNLPTFRFQINSYASSPESAGTLADAVRVAMNDYSGAMGAVTVQHITLVDEADLPPIATEDTTRMTFGIRQDWEVSYNE